jgi:hypothetical protein
MNANENKEAPNGAGAQGSPSTEPPIIKEIKFSNLNEEAEMGRV